VARGAGNDDSGRWLPAAYFVLRRAIFPAPFLAVDLRRCAVVAQKKMTADGFLAAHFVLRRAIFSGFFLAIVFLPPLASLLLAAALPRRKR